MSADQIDARTREQGTDFLPKFDEKGLLSAVVVHAETSEVLMVAFMDREALDSTIESGDAHFHSRSRGRLWKKGETSGHVLKVEERTGVSRHDLRPDIYPRDYPPAPDARFDGVDQQANRVAA